MTKQVNQAITETAAEMDGVQLYHGYSGRGMFGRQCAGFTVSRDLGVLTFFGLLLQELLVQDDHEEAVSCLAEMMENAQQDSMGLDTIVYFPSFVTFFDL